MPGISFINRDLLGLHGITDGDQMQRAEFKRLGLDCVLEEYEFLVSTSASFSQLTVRFRFLVSNMLRVGFIPIEPRTILQLSSELF